jgi:nucleoside 2-deoxyribosyltransferase
LSQSALKSSPLVASLPPYKDRPLVYIAGPYTKPDPVENTTHVIALASELVDEGLITPLVPHLTLLWHLVRPRPLEFWYEYDVATLARCDALFRMPGESTGADREVEFARAHDIPVFTDLKDLREWARAKLT